MDPSSLIGPAITLIITVTATVVTLKTMLNGVVKDLAEIKADFKELKEITSKHSQQLAVTEYRVTALEVRVRDIEQD